MYVGKYHTIYVYGVQFFSFSMALKKFLLNINCLYIDRESNKRKSYKIILSCSLYVLYNQYNLRTIIE